MSDELLFAFVRTHTIDTRSYLRSQARHAARSSPTAETRPGATPGLALRWSIIDKPNDYVAAYEAHKEKAAAAERTGAALGLHLLIGVSPEWIEEGGDLHDPRNPRNALLMEHAVKFAQQVIGGVYAARLDLDEFGGGVVDVFAAPVHMRKPKSSKTGPTKDPVAEISVRKALKAAQMATEEKHSYAALQTLWAKVAKTMDPRLMRGKPKVETGRLHLSVPEFRQGRAEIEKGLRQARGLQATALNHAARVYASEAELKRREEELAEQARWLETDLKRQREQALLGAMTAGILQAENLALIDRANEDLAHRARTVRQREMQSQLAQEIFERRVVEVTAREQALAFEKAELSARVQSLEQREIEIIATRADLENRVAQIARIAGQVAKARQAIEAKPHLDPTDELILKATESVHNDAVKAIRLRGPKLSGRGNGR